MAKSKLNVTFLKKFTEQDTISISVTTPLGTQILKERFVDTLPLSGRPAGWVLISANLSTQADLLLKALNEDYLSRGYVTFSKNNATVSYEAVNECSIPSSCIEYSIFANKGTVFSVSYTKCDGTPDSIIIDSGDEYPVCSKTYPSVISGFGLIYKTGSDCGGTNIIGPTTFVASFLPPDDTSYSIQIINNDCSGNIGDLETEGFVFSEAIINPCENINICVTTSELLVTLGKIEDKRTNWDCTFPLNSSGIPQTGSFNDVNQWKTIIMDIDENGGCPDLYNVDPPPTSQSGQIPYTFSSSAWDPNRLNPYPYQFFLRNSTEAQTVNFKIAYNASIEASYNTVYDLFLMVRSSGGVTKEWRHIFGNEQINVGQRFYAVSYEGSVSIEPGDSVMFVEHVLGSIAASRVVGFVAYQDFEFYVDCTVDNTVPNLDNPICKDVPRGVDYTLEGYDANDQFYSETFSVPLPLSVDDISIITVNTPLESTVNIEHNTGLALMYNIDGGDWQTKNIFYLPLNSSYTLNIKDEYGCEIAIVFDIDGEYYNEPKAVKRYSCSSLHELNVGKYLNLCGTQYTMKIGFVCNDQPNAIKIFKHIQMILNTEYSVKNVCVKTSQRQERLIPGTHIVYRVRESMHSVPLKNPEDFDDLRGSWAYIEIEIESIDNQKVDLFSVIAHLRKSSI